VIQNYAELQAAIADWLNRDDLTAEIPTFIQLAEARIKDDDRLINQIVTRLAVATQEVALPTDFVENDALAHDGPTYFFDVEPVAISQLPDFMLSSSESGVPRAVSFIDQQRARFAPIPNASYDLLFSYFQTVRSLDGVTVQSNWLLDERPDIYLYASLIEASAFLRDPENEAKYEAKYEEKAENYKISRERGQFAGQMRRKPSVAIGAFGTGGYSGGRSGR